MTKKKLLSVIDIIKELNIGKVTTKFLLKRFGKWMPYDLIDGQPFYPIETIKKLFMIQESLEMGMLPSDIEKKLDASCSSDEPYPLFENQPMQEDVRLSMDGLNLLKSVFRDIGEQQKRIAIAHEKRAAAEERKAAAIEKRAEAEEKKADAMNNIADALQEMNTLRGGDPAVQQIVHQASAVITNYDPDNTDKKAPPIKMDNLSLLLDEAENNDDLSLLLDDTKEQNELMDDLSILIDEVSCPETESDQLDDLSLSLDNVSSEEDIQTDQTLMLDDLSALIDQNGSSIKTEPPVEPSDELDDLLKLIDDPLYESVLPYQNLDDLSLLIEQDPVLKEETNNTVQDEDLKMDDLSKLIDDQTNNGANSFDNEESKNTPVIKIDVAPEDNLEKYKAAVMKIIIGLEADGLDVEAATNRLNQNKVKTLSGNPKWNQKAILQIYKFIRSAK
ncbi:hypothetical protein [Desulfobacula phenolica]|uniref:MerR HTH family regulatory protein n=1 Tax=Desulfobacula phenolica TaxID=90732 RepID=A0A1H2EMI1_9BACT|nr:hypothetical protein [Desulfobacula phenolica]SDT96326.1 hypothetical protein SAMN04487931_103232 [Desulfobacula phenolica]